MGGGGSWFGHVVVWGVRPFPDSSETAQQKVDSRGDGGADLGVRATALGVHLHHVNS